MGFSVQGFLLTFFAFWWQFIYTRWLPFKASNTSFKCCLKLQQMISSQVATGSWCCSTTVVQNKIIIIQPAQSFNIGQIKWLYGLLQSCNSWAFGHLIISLRDHWQPFRRVSFPSITCVALHCGTFSHGTIHAFTRDFWHWNETAASEYTVTL